MNRFICFFLCAVGANATTSVVVSAVNQAQFILTVTTDQPGNCTYRVCKGAGCPLGLASMVNDVDPVQFPGSNSDARPGAVGTGTTHQMVIGTRGVYPVNTAGKRVHRTLQTATAHTYGVSCGADPEVTGTTSTTTVPIGEGFSWRPPIDFTAWHGLAQPTLDFTAAGQSIHFIDDLTGVDMVRVTSPASSLANSFTQGVFDYVEDKSNGAWMNPQYAKTNQVSGTLASTTAMGAKLFLARNRFDGTANANWGTNSVPMDARLRPYGHGTGNAVGAVCWTLDSTTCASRTLTFSVPNGGNAGLGTLVPASDYPTPNFQEWGPWTLPPSPALLVNGNGDSPTVNVSDNVVTKGSGANGTMFEADWPVGARVQIAGCPNGVSTIATPPVVNPSGGAWTTSMTIADHCGSLTGAAFQYLGGGLLIWMVSGQSMNVSFTLDATTADQSFNPASSNGYFNVASFGMITDINTDRFGNPTGPQEGELASFSGLQLFIPRTGETRQLSDFYSSGTQSQPVSGYMQPITSAWSSTDPKTFSITASNNHFFTGRLNLSGTYKEFIPTVYPPVESNIVYTDISATATPIATQLAAHAGDPNFADAATAFATGLFGSGFTPVQAQNGYIFWNASPIGGAGDQPLIIAISDPLGNLLQAYTTWTQYPLRWGGEHSAPLPLLHYNGQAVNPLESFSGALGGPYVVRIVGMWHGGTYVPNPTFPITGFTNASTFPKATSTGISLDPYINANWGTGDLRGPFVVLAGGTGAWAGANTNAAAWKVANVPSVSSADQNDFTMPDLDTSAFGSYTGTGQSMTIQTNQSLMNANITGVTNASPPVVTTNNTLGGNTNLGHGFLNGDSIEFGGAAGVQYFAKVLTPYTFAVYTNAALTTPALYANIPHGGAVHFSEVCPVGLPPLLTKMQFDTGAVGPRCITIRTSQPCDLFAGPAEIKAYPPAGGCPANSSSLQALAMGDALQDPARGGFSEKFVVVKSTPAGGGMFDNTLMRFYGNNFGGTYIPHSDTSGGSHSVGFLLMPVPSVGEYGSVSGFVDIQDPVHPLLALSSSYTGCHSDLGYGYPVGAAFSYTGGASSNGCLGPIVNQSFSNLVAALNHPVTSPPFNYWPTFANNAATQFGGVESYPNMRTFYQTSLSSTTRFDFRAVNPAAGNGQGGGSAMFNGVAVPALVSGRSNVYQLQIATGQQVNIKTTPLLGYAGSRLFHDISAHGAALTDDNHDAMCVAYFANDCVTGSTPGQAFASFVGATTSTPACWTNTYDAPTPCIFPMGGDGGWAVQDQIQPLDNTATYTRRLTMCLSAPALQFSFQTNITEATGTWNACPVAFLNGITSQLVAYRIPPWPANQVNPQNRKNFINIPIPVPSYPGADQATIVFGYSEMDILQTGDVYNCAYYADHCNTNIPTGAGHANDPFAFVDEPSTYTSCASGCTINIPAIPSGVVHYQIQYYNSGTFVATGASGMTMAAP